MSAITEDAASRDPVLALAPTSAAPIATTSQRRASPRSISTALILSAGLILAASVAHSAVKISSAATSNMTCANGVCAPTAKDAVLNAGDLETLLASGKVEVTTTGAAIQAKDIEIDAPLSWSSANTLALDAYDTITIEKPVTVAGLGGLSIATNDGGTYGYFGFGAKGHVAFTNLSSALTINGAAYTLVGDIATLASDIAANSAGNYALANSYNAKPDGTYKNAPIKTIFNGNFDGLGNVISHLSINDQISGDYDALFAETGSGGAIENIVLQKEDIDGNELLVGGLVALNQGLIENSFASGSFASTFHQPGPEIGALVAYNVGRIIRSGAAGIITSGNSQDGGLVGSTGPGAIEQSYANCKIFAGDMSFLGGLAGGSYGTIGQSYASGSVDGGAGSSVGGLAGVNGSVIAQAYSTTTVKVTAGRHDHDRGGLIGDDESTAGSISSSYWDTTTSRVKSRRKGAGTPKDDPGITGLTSAQLQSGLPAGFDPKVWAEDPKINGGFPYLIANPPRE